MTDERKFPLPSSYPRYARYRPRRPQRRPHMSPLNVELGAALRKFRRQRGWTQEQLATKLRISPALLRRYEQGRSIMSVPTLIALCHVFV